MCVTLTKSCHLIISSFRIAEYEMAVVIANFSCVVIVCCGGEVQCQHSQFSCFLVSDQSEIFHACILVMFRHDTMGCLFKCVISGS